MFRLNELTTINDVKKYCDTHFTLIGSGTSRYVYDIGNNTIIKVPQNERGIWQNESEIHLYRENSCNPLLLPLENKGDNCLWVSYKKVNLINEENKHLFKEYHDVHFHELRGLIMDINFKLKKKEIIYSKSNNTFIRSIEDFLINNKILFVHDLFDLKNWGYINNQIYLIDYGMNNDTYKKYIIR